MCVNPVCDPAQHAPGPSRAVRGLRPSPPARGLVSALVLAAAAAASADAQDRVADFRDRPILVLDTGGHHAPVHRLIFTADEKKLLSAGEDKVVRVLDISGDTPAPGWTIRPPVWRGRAGAIYDMALSPPDARGAQTLALGGIGVVRGEIGLFRFPGAADRRGGDIDAYLAGGGVAEGRQNAGHTNTVKCLAFDPKRDRLASGGLDATVLVWDVSLVPGLVARPSPTGELRGSGVSRHRLYRLSPTVPGELGERLQGRVEPGVFRHPAVRMERRIAEQSPQAAHGRMRRGGGYAPKPGKVGLVDR